VETFREQGPDDIARFVSLLEDRIAAWPSDGLALACGPTPFMRTVKAVAERVGLRLQVSLENRMACGVGACLGCVTKPADGGLPVQSCTSGPVFWAGEVLL
jgi:dihydroorotate dehydrogenase electron transfer subunit